jgi:serine phosphatase RsbU (regulator of sigma subunit)
VLDVQNPDGERFNVERILQGVYGRYEQAHDMIDAVLVGVEAFRAGTELPDDLTLVAIQLQPAPAPRRAPLAAHAR